MNDERSSHLDESDFDHDFRTGAGDSPPKDAPLRDREPEPDPDFDARLATPRQSYSAAADRPKPKPVKAAKSKAERRRALRRWVVFPALTVLLATVTGIVVAASIHRP